MRKASVFGVGLAVAMLACAGAAPAYAESKSYACTFETGSAWGYDGGAFASKAAEPLSFEITDIDLEGQSALSDGEALPAGRIWKGSPARDVGVFDHTDRPARPAVSGLRRVVEGGYFVRPRTPGQQLPRLDPWVLAISPNTVSYTHWTLPTTAELAAPARLVH